MTDYFFKDHELLVIQGKARLHGLRRIISSKESCALLQERERRHLRCARLGHATPVETLQPCRGRSALREGLWRLRNKSGMRPCRGAEALGYGMQSPPARTMADYLLKDHQPAPSLVSDIRTHNSPFSLYGRRGRGMKGKSVLECGKSLILCRAGLNQRAGKQYHDNRLGRGVDYFHPAGIPPGAGVSRRLCTRADAALQRVAQKEPEPA
jgi:hypothetical protein